MNKRARKQRLARIRLDDEALRPYGPGKQQWKENGNYYTAEELREMDKINDFQLSHPSKIVMDG